jgi:hypothetical protein
MAAWGFWMINKMKNEKCNTQHEKCMADIAGPGAFSVHLVFAGGFDLA